MEKEYIKEVSLESKDSSLESNDVNPNTKYSSFISCTINLLKSTLGSGMLLLPYAFSKYGILLGLLISLSAALLSSLGLSFLVFSANHVVQKGSCPPREVSYGSLATITIGKWSVLVDLVMFVKCFLVGVQYLIIVRQNIPIIVNFIFPSTSDEYFSPKVQLFLSILAISYFCFQPKMDALKVTSIFGLIGIAYLFVLGIWISLKTEGDTFFGKMNWFMPTTKNISSIHLINLLSYFIFCYVCHPSLLPIYNEVKSNSSPSMMKMVSLSIGGCFISYSMFSILYYGLYGDDVEPFILNHFELDSSSSFTYEFLLARVFFIFLMIFTFPLQAFPARVSLLKVIGNFWSWWSSSSSSAQEVGGGGEVQEEKTSNDLSVTAVPGGKDGKVFYVVTFIMLVVSFLMASNIPDIKTLSSIVGASTGPLICYVFPAIFWIGLDRSYGPMKILSYTLLVLGITLIPILLYSIISS